jgi:S-adenosylmethionine synthetase
MPNRSWLFTSESVSEGHPDKVCDRISDEIVDAYLAADPQSRVACETLATTNFICVAGEVRGPSDVLQNIEARIRNAVRDIGYAQDGFHWENNEIVVKLHEQSADIALGVDSGAGKDEGAGDQGIMFGYACTETKELMPAPIVFSHRILQFMAEARRAGREQFLGPDSKSQVTLRYENGKPVAVDSIIVSTQHVVGLDQSAVRAIVKPYIAKALPQGWTCPEDRLLVNPTGRFVIGGPDGDCGVTGRKIIVDTYGGAAPHGGGAFSGKDPSKVDRSAAYAARWLAKNVVAAGLADKCQIQLAYAIGVAEPVALYIETFGTANVDIEKLEKTLRDMVTLTPRGIRTQLGLNRPIYARTAAYGHFGRAAEDDGAFSWERLSLADELARTFGGAAQAAE